MISRNKPVTKIYDNLYPQAKKHQIPAYTDQNNYSFSTKQSHLLEQQSNTSRINGDTFKNRRRNSSFALNSNEQNIKAIDQKIQAILKKHAGQKEILQDLMITKQTTINTNKPSKDILKQSAQILSRGAETKKSTKKQHHQVPQFRQSQMLLNRPYSSVIKQAKYETNKKQTDNPLNQKIKMLNQRIKKAEQQKKKLNIKFKPFAFEGGLQPEQKQQKQLTFLDEKIKQLTVNNEPVLNPYAAKTVKQSKKTVLEVQSEPLGRIKRQKSSFKEFKNLQQNKKVPIRQLNQPNLKATEQLLEALIEQIKLDQTLRNLKIWFTFYNETSKWEILKQKLAKKKEYSTKQLREIFQSNIEEHNPFFKWDSIEFDQGLQALIKAYEDSSQHWEKFILNRWKKSSFQSSGLRKKIQYERRCQAIVLQDIVRFINLQKDSFFRNRDLFLIYMRLCDKSNKLTYQKFLNAITQRQQQ